MKSSPQGVSPTRQLGLVCHDSLAAGRRAEDWEVHAAALLAVLELKSAQSNNGIHPTRVSVPLIVSSAVPQLHPGG